MTPGKTGTSQPKEDNTTSGVSRLSPFLPFLVVFTFCEILADLICAPITYLLVFAVVWSFGAFLDGEASYNVALAFQLLAWPFVFHHLYCVAEAVIVIHPSAKSVGSVLRRWFSSLVR
jgi:hypothetical protein